MNPSTVKKLRGLELERITIKLRALPKALDGLTIAHLSDTHFPQPPKRSAIVLAAAARERPDIIVFTGDMLNDSAHPGDAGIYEFCHSLKKIAPTFVIYGNHELRSKNLGTWRSTVLASGVELLENNEVLYEKNGGKLWIQGLDDRLDYKDSALFFNSECKLLLHHRPMYKVRKYPPNGSRPDVIFSGHAHGGQVRLPGIGGVLAPDQWLFPRYTSGLYKMPTGSYMVMSRGLGHRTLPLRLGNPFHIPLITLKYGEEEK